jgi:Tfp pilus assembly protein PilV
MSRRQLHRRLRARLDADERGFSIIETMVAITVIFASLVTLAYTATAAFRYVAISRDRIQANAYANLVMEEVRALPHAEVTKGLSSNDVTGDAAIATCAEGRCFEGDTLVVSTFPTGRETSPLYPHVTREVFDGLDVTRRVYVTTDETGLYHVTVIVTWVSSSPGTNEVRMESDFYSPKGCVSSATHPYAAPCQPFFYARAEVPEGGITFEGTFYGTAVDVSGGLAFLPTLEANAQQEQTTTAAASVDEGEAVLIDSLGGQEVAGGETWRVDTDTDPSTPDVGTVAGFPEQTADEDVLERSGTSEGRWVQIGAAAWGNDRYQASASSEVTGTETYKCPLGATTFPASVLNLPCASARLQKLIHARVRLELGAQELGSAFLARLNSPSTTYSSTSTNWWKAQVQRESTTSDGRISSLASRYMGSMRFGGFPDNGYSLLRSTGEAFSTGTGNATNYCFRIDGYNATVMASAGYTPGTVDAVQNGTFWYYDQSTQKFTTTGTALSSASLASLHILCERGGYAPTGQYAKWRVEVLPGGITPGSIAEVPQTGTAPYNDTQEAAATARPPTIVYRYQILVGPNESATLSPVVDLLVTVDLGELTAEATYGPPPPRG